MAFKVLKIGHPDHGEVLEAEGNRVPQRNGTAAYVEPFAPKLEWFVLLSDEMWRDYHGFGREAVEEAILKHLLTPLGRELLVRPESLRRTTDETGD